MTRLHKIKRNINQAAKPGLLLWEKSHHLRIAVVITFALLLVTANSMALNPGRFTGERIDLASLNKSQMMRYARSVQETVAKNPDMLLKLSGEDVRLILAAPDLQRVDNPSVIWQYRTASCVLDVYFTADGTPDKADVAYFEVRARASDKAEPEAGICLQGLYQSRAQQIAAAFRQIFASYDQGNRKAG
jgi:hypothetical protein